jgi:hypothetical protein
MNERCRCQAFSVLLSDDSNSYRELIPKISSKLRPQQDSNLRTRLRRLRALYAESCVDLRKRGLKGDWDTISIVILSCRGLRCDERTADWQARGAASEG